MPQQIFSRRVLYAVLVLGMYLALQGIWMEGPIFIYGGSFSGQAYRGWPWEYFRESWTGYFGSSQRTPSAITISYWVAAIDAAMGVAVVLTALLAYDIARSCQVTLRQLLWLVVLLSVACRIALDTYWFLHPAMMFSLLVIIVSATSGYLRSRATRRSQPAAT